MPGRWRRLSQVGDVTLIAIMCAIERESAAVETNHPDAEPQDSVPEVLTRASPFKAHSKEVPQHRVCSHNRPLCRAGMKEVVECRAEQAVPCPARGAYHSRPRWPAAMRRPRRVRSGSVSSML